MMATPAAKKKNGNTNEMEEDKSLDDVYETPGGKRREVRIHDFRI
jgi:hypothetical protein